VIGVPAQPAKEFFRELATLRRMARRDMKSSKKSDSVDKTDG
jgi:hypothetical protein